MKTWPQEHMARLLSVCSCLVALGAAGGVPARGQEFSSPLSDLANPRPGRALHEGSWDRKGLNDDALHVPAGKTVTIFEHEGSGCVHRFWVTIAPRIDIAILSQAILRMYWDGDANPSVECPIGAFFGVGFGEQKDYISMPLDETSGGYNCYWPMPFHRSARWTLTNGSGKAIDAFYYNIDFTALDSLPADTRHFHAQFRRENPTTLGRDYTILETSGAGHYVGTALFMAGRGLYFLEGNERVYVDGEARPSIEGTGTEDYFSSGWYFDHGTYSAPYHGLVIKDEKRSRVSAYRWHIEDAIPFTRSIRFTIEHGTGSLIQADYSSVAYYYLAGPSPAPPPLPADLLPSNLSPLAAWQLPGAVEGESLKASAKANGRIWIQDMRMWGSEEQWSQGNALLCSMAHIGGKLTLQVPSATAGTFLIHARMVAGPLSGVVQPSLGGAPLGVPVDLYAPRFTPKMVDLGPVTLAHGDNALVFEMTGKNPATAGLQVGVDAFVVEPSK